MRALLKLLLELRFDLLDHLAIILLADSNKKPVFRYKLPKCHLLAVALLPNSNSFQDTKVAYLLRYKPVIELEGSPYLVGFDATDEEQVA